jgi:small subunit ribosomal protein S4
VTSYQVRPDDVITIKPDSGVTDVVRQATELTAAVPPWLQADHDALTAKVLRLPDRDEIIVPIEEQLIVELYSK